MRNYAEYPCGADGLSFPNGLPNPGQKVEVITVWSRGEWEPKIFQETYDYKRTYDWFGVYARPRVDEGSNPIVLEWRETQQQRPAQ